MNFVDMSKQDFNGCSSVISVNWPTVSLRLLFLLVDLVSLRHTPITKTQPPATNPPQKQLRDHLCSSKTISAAQKPSLQLKTRPTYRRTFQPKRFLQRLQRIDQPKPNLAWRLRRGSISWSIRSASTQEPAESPILINLWRNSHHFTFPSISNYLLTSVMYYSNWTELHGKQIPVLLWLLWSSQYLDVSSSTWSNPNFCLDLHEPVSHIARNTSFVITFFCLWLFWAWVCIS